MRLMLRTQNVHREVRETTTTLVEALERMNVVHERVCLRILQRRVGSWSWRPGGGLFRLQMERCRADAGGLFFSHAV